MPEELTLSQALEKIKTYEAKFKDLTSKVDVLTAAKKAEEGEDAEDAKFKKHEGEDAEDAKTHMAEASKYMKSAEVEEDPEKVKEAIRKATTHMAKAKKMMAEEDKKEEPTEKEEKTDQASVKTAKTLKVLTAMVIKPKIQLLNQAYRGMVSEEKLKQFNANWINMGITELDEEIEKVKPFVGNTLHETQIPMSFSTEQIPEQFSASTNIAETYTAKVDEMDVSELFGGKA